MVGIVPSRASELAETDATLIMRQFINEHIVNNSITLDGLVVKVEIRELSREHGVSFQVRITLFRVSFDVIIRVRVRDWGLG